MKTAAKKQKLESVTAIAPASADTVAMVPIGSLRFSKELDPRKKKTNNYGLKASISTHGILQSLLVRPTSAEPDTYEIIAGNRRLTTLTEIIDEQLPYKGGPPITWATQVPVLIRSSDERGAMEAAFVENVEREDLHPVDRYERFAVLHADGENTADIAARYGYTETSVRQQLALGNGIAEDIRKAWRDGVISAEVAQAFTLSRDQRRQMAIFRKLKSSKRLQADAVKTEIGVNEDANKALRTIGVEEFKAAGGIIAEDLFGDDPVIGNPDLAIRLAREKIVAVCDSLVAEGWQFAVDKSTVKNTWNYKSVGFRLEYTPAESKLKTTLAARVMELEDKSSEAWDRSNQAAADAFDKQVDAIQDEMAELDRIVTLRAVKPAHRKKSGCFVDVNHRGYLSITYGLQRPADLKKEDQAKEVRAREKAGESGEEAATAVSLENTTAALAYDLSAMKTQAIASVLASAPGLALRVLLATLVSRYGSFLKMHANGMPGIELPPPEAGRACIAADLEFDQAFTAAEQLDDDEVGLLLAGEIAQGADGRIHNVQGHVTGMSALISSLSSARWGAAANSAFKAELYFSKISADMCRDAIAQMTGRAAAPAAAKKADLVRLAVDEQKRTGWLPPQLRHPEGTR